MKAVVLDLLLSQVGVLPPNYFLVLFKIYVSLIRLHLASSVL